MLAEHIQEQTVADLGQAMSAYFAGLLAEHGDTPKGVDWHNPFMVDVRYRVMLEVIRERDFLSTELHERISILDLGCGTGGLLNYLFQRNLAQHFDYTGVDICPQMIARCKEKFPGYRFFCVDVLKDTPRLSNHYRYGLMNGILTQKLAFSQQQMWQYARGLLEWLFDAVEEGIAFNVTSWHLAEHRDNLFHVPFDEMAWFLSHRLSRLFCFRNDYKPEEYTTYVYHPRLQPGAIREMDFLQPPSPLNKQSRQSADTPCTGSSSDVATQDSKE